MDSLSILSQFVLRLSRLVMLGMGASCPRAIICSNQCLAASLPPSASNPILLLSFPIFPSTKSSYCTPQNLLTSGFVYFEPGRYFYDTTWATWMGMVPTQAKLHWARWSRLIHLEGKFSQPWLSLNVWYLCMAKHLRLASVTFSPMLQSTIGKRGSFLDGHFHFLWVVT